MRVSEIKTNLPHVADVLGEIWIKAQYRWLLRFIASRIKWYAQAEADLQLLCTRINPARVRSCYRALLRDRRQVQKCIYEIHGAAFLSTIATRVELHVPRGDNSGRNFDVRVEIEGHTVNADSKTRKDEFPFNLSKRKSSSKGHIDAGVRATIDPHDAMELGLGVKRPSDFNYINTPESTVIRQTLLDGLTQLPQPGCNLIIFGHIEGQQRNVEDALFGAAILKLRKNLKTRQIDPEWVRSPTGAFGRGPEGEAFRGLSGVLWVRLFKTFDSDLFRDYKLYLNPHANVCIPGDVQRAIEKSAKEWVRLPGKQI